jgi:hypothetical protein
MSAYSWTVARPLLISLSLLGYPVGAINIETDAHRSYTLEVLKKMMIR